MKRERNMQKEIKKIGEKPKVDKIEKGIRSLVY